MSSMKTAIKHFLRRLGWQLGRVVPPGPGIPVGMAELGMEATFTALRHRGFMPNVVVDVGAARGQFTTDLLPIWPRSRYLLIEPLTEWHPALEHLCQSHPSVEYVQGAAGARPGTATIHIPTSLEGSSLFQQEGESRNVPLYTVDDLLSHRGLTVDLLKIDVQGYERFVLQGATLSLRECAFVLLECQFYRFGPEMIQVHETVAYMAESGFIPYEIAGILRRPIDGAMGQCDILFCRKDHPYFRETRWADS